MIGQSQVFREIQKINERISVCDAPVTKLAEDDANSRYYRAGDYRLILAQPTYRSALDHAKR